MFVFYTRIGSDRGSPQSTTMFAPWCVFGCKRFSGVRVNNLNDAAPGDVVDANNHESK